MFFSKENKWSKRNGKDERRKEKWKIQEQRPQKRTEYPTSSRAKSQKQYFAAITTADRSGHMPRDIRARPPPAEAMRRRVYRRCPPQPPDPVRQLPRPSDPTGPPRHPRPGRCCICMLPPAAGGTGSVPPSPSTCAPRAHPRYATECGRFPAASTAPREKAWRGAPRSCAFYAARLCQTFCHARMHALCMHGLGRFRRATGLAATGSAKRALKPHRQAAADEVFPVLRDHGPRRAHAHGKEKGPTVSDDGRHLLRKACCGFRISFAPGGWIWQRSWPPRKSSNSSVGGGLLRRL